MRHQFVFVGRTGARVVELSCVCFQIVDGGLHHGRRVEFVGKGAVDVHISANLVGRVGLHVAGIPHARHKLPKSGGVDGVEYLLDYSVAVALLLALKGVAAQGRRDAGGEKAIEVVVKLKRLPRQHLVCYEKVTRRLHRVGMKARDEEVGAVAHGVGQCRTHDVTIAAGYVPRPCHRLGVGGKQGIDVLGKAVHLVVMHRRERHPAKGEANVIPSSAKSVRIGVAQCFQVVVGRHGILWCLTVDDILRPLFVARNIFIHLHHLRVAVLVFRHLPHLFLLCYHLRRVQFLNGRGHRRGVGRALFNCTDKHGVAAEPTGNLCGCVLVVVGEHHRRNT